MMTQEQRDQLHIQWLIDEGRYAGYDEVYGPCAAGDICGWMPLPRTTFGKYDPGVTAAHISMLEQGWIIGEVGIERVENGDISFFDLDDKAIAIATPATLYVNGVVMPLTEAQWSKIVTTYWTEEWAEQFGGSVTNSGSLR